jgi:hypothetical protein
MDESINNDKEQTKSSFIDDAINCFARNLFAEQEEMMGRKEPGEHILGEKTKLKPFQQWHEGHNYTREEIQEIVKRDMDEAGMGSADSIYAARAKKDRMVDNGCPLLNNIDQLWCQIGEVFPEFQTANPDRLTNLLAAKCPKCDIKWEAGGNLQVNGATTNISHKDVKEVFCALKKLVSDKTADQVIASILAKKIKKLF